MRLATRISPVVIWVVLRRDTFDLASKKSHANYFTDCKPGGLGLKLDGLIELKTYTLNYSGESNEELFQQCAGSDLQ